jgi:hypothetical protein
MKETVKGYCKESKCEYDVYTKEKIDDLLSKIPISYTKNEIDTTVQTLNASINNCQKKITSGTSEPSGGEDGDIYIKY